MSFNNTYRQVVERKSPGHVWIALHRLVEAYGRTFGIRFSVVFGELERQFEFRRGVRSEWPTLATMHEAARWLRIRRDEALARRDKLVFARRRAKRCGQRVPVFAELLAIERMLGGGALVPHVGVWGWRKRRERVQRDSG
jgi:hypothetical protein